MQEDREMAQLIQAATEEDRARAEAKQATARTKAALKRYKASHPDATLEEIGAAIDRTPERVRWYLRADPTQWRKPADAPPPPSKAHTDPAQGMSLQVAAPAVGLTRAGLRNAVADAATTPGVRRTFTVRGRTVHVIAGDGEKREAWRVWIGQENPQ